MGVKSLSTSTERFFLGRSLMWPSEALTRYCRPRYLPMVFAFAGDSTMTRFLAMMLLDPYLLNNRNLSTTPGRGLQARLPPGTGSAPDPEKGLSGKLPDQAAQLEFE